MKSLMFLMALVCAVAFSAGCSQKPKAAASPSVRQRWEYKFVDADNITGDLSRNALMVYISETNTPAEKRDARDQLEMFDRGRNTFLDPDLDKLGGEGWELTGIFTINETVQCRPENSDSHKDAPVPNFRTGRVRFVFKRPVN